MINYQCVLSMIFKFIKTNNCVLFNKIFIFKMRKNINTRYSKKSNIIKPCKSTTAWRCSKILVPKIATYKALKSRFLIGWRKNPIKYEKQRLKLCKSVELNCIIHLIIFLLFFLYIQNFNSCIIKLYCDSFPFSNFSIGFFFIFCFGCQLMISRFLICLCQKLICLIRFHKSNFKL